MSKKEEMKEGKQKKNEAGAQCPARCGAVAKTFVFISIVFALTMAFLVIWPVANKSKEVRDVKVCLEIPNDSLMVENVLKENDSQINKLIGELDKQSQEITDKYNVLLRSQETESDFFRLVSCIAAFVVALIGFLGYKTIKDIEEKAQAVAKKQADVAAEEYVSKHLEQEVESQLKDIIGNTTAAKLLNEQLLNQVIPQLITPLENRITKLESAPMDPAKEEAHTEEAPYGTFAHNDEAEIAKLTQEGGGEAHE